MLQSYLEKFFEGRRFMVFFFTSNAVNPSVTLYMGKDKFENEELIAYGWPEDIWFHVDELSSAHVYLRLAPDENWEAIPQALVDDCCQLTKANSIQGCKLSSVNVIYTPWTNLHKASSMDVGAVGFHDQKKVKKLRIETSKEIINRLNKTKVEKIVDLRAIKEERDNADRVAKKAALKVQKKKEEEEERRQKEAEEIKRYASLLKSSKMESNRRDSKSDFKSLEDDFM